MEWIWWLVAFSLLLICMVAVSKVKITIRYDHQADDDQLTVTLSVFRFITFHWDIPVIALSSTEPALIVKDKTETPLNRKEQEIKETPEKLLQQMKMFRELVKHVGGLHHIVRRFMRKVKVHDFQWKTYVGLGDAVYSSLLAGSVWALKSSLIGFLSTYVAFQTIPLLDVKPNYHQVVTKTSLRCIVSFRIGHAMIAGLMLVRKGNDMYSLFTKWRKKQMQGGVFRV